MSREVYDVLMFSLHEQKKNRYNEITSGLQLSQKSGQLIDMAVKKGLSKWVNTVAKYQESVGLLLELGDSSKKNIHEKKYVLQEVLSDISEMISQKYSKTRDENSFDLSQLKQIIWWRVTRLDPN